VSVPEKIINLIARSLYIEAEDFDYTPFNQMGGLGKAYRFFRTELNTILAELNERLVG